MLDQQYRMQSKILKIPNELFYNNKIKTMYHALFIDHEFHES